MWEEVTGALFEWRDAGCLWSDGLLSVPGHPAWIKGLLVSVNHFGPGLNPGSFCGVLITEQTLRTLRLYILAARLCSSVTFKGHELFALRGPPPAPSSSSVPHTATHTHTEQHLSGLFCMLFTASVCFSSLKQRASGGNHGNYGVGG